jgi:hypothetical protein
MSRSTCRTRVAAIATRLTPLCTILSLSLLTACSDDESAAPTPTVAAATATRTVTVFPSVTSTASALPTSTRTPTEVPTATPTSPLPTRTPTETRTITETPTVTVTETPVPQDPSAVAFREALAPVCNPGSSPEKYTLSGAYDNFATLCEKTGRHKTAASISGYPSEEAAELIFQAALAQDECLTEGVQFRDLPTAMCSKPFFDGLEQTWVWRDGCWVVRVRSSDETDALIAPQPDVVSAVIADTGAEIGLFATCPPLRADLLPYALSASYFNTGRPCEGPFFADLTVCVRNQGAGAAGPFSVVIEGMAPFEIEGLEPSGQRCESTPFIGVSGNFTAIVDPENAIAETDELNNSITRSVSAPLVPATCTLTPTPTPEPAS